MPYINGVFSKISGFPQTDSYVTAAENVYPGDKQCKVYSPHAVWHEQSANGFVEVIMLADYVNGVLSKAIAARDASEKDNMFIQK
jgi:hypothetical protein